MFYECTHDEDGTVYKTGGTREKRNERRTRGKRECVSRGLNGVSGVYL